MKITLLVHCLLISFVKFSRVSAQNAHSTSVNEHSEEALSENTTIIHAVQIITPVNHSLQIKSSEIKRILEVDKIKDRNIVVISFASTIQSDEHFLLDFFLRYLYAQYKKHNASNWLTENGYKWRNELESETTGIWMWPEIFTYDRENGKKLAVILLETRGDRNDLKEFKSIFTLSMMLSSVQCYITVEDIKEDDFQHLEMLGRLTTVQPNQIRLQRFLFIIRDWSYKFDSGYGLHGLKRFYDVIDASINKSTEMQQLQDYLSTSYADVNVCFLPYPNKVVSNTNPTQGRQSMVSAKEEQPNNPSFKAYLKELVSSLFAPRNLMIKHSNGQKVYARDFLEFLQIYSKVFDGNIPFEPEMIQEATIEVKYLLRHRNCLNFYIDSMHKALNGIKIYLNQSELIAAHEKAKTESLSMHFLGNKTLGDEKLASIYLQRTEDEIEKQFLEYKTVYNSNSEVNAYYAKLHLQSIEFFEEFFFNKTDGLDMALNYTRKLLPRIKEKTLNQFAQKKLDVDDFYWNSRKRLEAELEVLIPEKLKWSVTRYGFLTLTFEGAVAANLVNGNWCDILSRCDLYIKVLVGYEEIFKSDVVWDTKYVTLNKTATTYKISKTARIIIEMWDFDVWSPHDLMQSWEHNPDQLLAHNTSFVLYGTGENGIRLSSSWKADSVEDKILRGEVNDYDYDEYYDTDEPIDYFEIYYRDIIEKQKNCTLKCWFFGLFKSRSSESEEDDESQ